MGKREQAREEARFVRGDVGVDGQSTNEEVKDTAELEREKAQEGFTRGRTWLGRELLTWLLWKSEAGDPICQHGEHGVVVTFVDRLTLRGIHGDVTELMVKGALSPYSQHVRAALDKGLLVHTARLRVTAGERSWETSLDAEFLDVRSAKVPELLTEEEDDRISERLDLADELAGMVEALVETFLAVRGSTKWNRDTVPKLKAWMRGEERNAQNVMDRARRIKAAS